MAVAVLVGDSWRWLLLGGGFTITGRGVWEGKGQRVRWGVDVCIYATVGGRGWKSVGRFTRCDRSLLFWKQPSQVSPVFEASTISKLLITRLLYIFDVLIYII